MRPTTLLFVFVLACCIAKAQTLQFSQVVMPTVLLNGATGSTATIGTVPAGKVWKLENYMTNDNYCVSMRVNGGSVNEPMIYSATNTSQFMNGSAFWFSTGTSLALYRTCNNTPTNATYHFSILEFTVTP